MRCQMIQEYEEYDELHHSQLPTTLKGRSLPRLFMIKQDLLTIGRLTVACLSGCRRQRERVLSCVNDNDSAKSQTFARRATHCYLDKKRCLIDFTGQKQLFSAIQTIYQRTMIIISGTKKMSRETINYISLLLPYPKGIGVSATKRKI